MSILAIAGMTESAAYKKFRAILWADNGGAPICPECGSRDVWTIRADSRWKCSKKGCRTQFSVTSHTIFKDRKLSFRKILTACALFANGVLGVAACRLSRELDITYKSAWVLLHKVREAMGNEAEAMRLGGVVEIDGAVFGGSLPRLPNAKELWASFKKKHGPAAKRRRKLVVVMRERDDLKSGVIGRVRTFLLGKEGDAIELARDVLLPDTIVHADMSPQWEPLHMLFDTKRINHTEHFSHNGACTNMAESFFERMRCAERGVHKHISGAHIHRYAMELGWREQYRRTSNGQQFGMLLTAVGRAEPSPTMRGYWQGRKPKGKSTPPPTDDDEYNAIAVLTGRQGAPFP